MDGSLGSAALEHAAKLTTALAGHGAIPGHIAR
jgi:hypothetical protein